MDRGARCGEWEGRTERCLRGRCRRAGPRSGGGLRGGGGGSRWRWSFVAPSGASCARGGRGVFFPKGGGVERAARGSGTFARGQDARADLKTTTGDALPALTAGFFDRIYGETWVVMNDESGRNQMAALHPRGRHEISEMGVVEAGQADETVIVRRVNCRREGREPIRGSPARPCRRDFGGLVDDFDGGDMLEEGAEFHHYVPQARSRTRVEGLVLGAAGPTVLLVRGEEKEFNHRRHRRNEEPDRPSHQLAICHY